VSTTSPDYLAAFARVAHDNPKLTISGFYIPCLPPPFTDKEIAEHTPMFSKCMIWVRAFHSVASGVAVDSDLARDCMMSWCRLHGDKEHIPLGVFTGACIHLDIAGARRRGRADVRVELKLAMVWDAMDAWQGVNGALGDPGLADLEHALEKSR
jgi:hypothetical protein